MGRMRGSKGLCRSFVAVFDVRVQVPLPSDSVGFEVLGARSVWVRAILRHFVRFAYWTFPVGVDSTDASRWK